MTTGNKYGWINDRSEESHSYLVPAVQDILKKYKVSSLLDIGTGNGATLPFWMSMGIKTSAMEPDAEGFAFASRHEGADVKQIGVGQPLPDQWHQAFDAVVCLEVIEHLFDPDQLLQTINHCLRPQGIVIVSTPYHGYLKNLAMALAGKWDFHHHPLRAGGHIKFWSEATVTELFSRHGYAKLDFRGVGRVPYLWKSMIVVFRAN